MKIKATREASPIETEAALTKEITALLEKHASANTSVEFVSPVDVREGAEKTGMAKLHVSGIFRTVTPTMPGEYVAHYRIDSAGSVWRNYGAPHGTKYDISLALVKMSAAEVSELAK
jgi:transcriptional regulator GlxA family with amidase domain